MKRSMAFISVALFAAVSLGADEPLAWPRFRGPNGSGVADGQRPPVEFGPDKNLKWKVPAPPGISSPIVAGDNLVITVLKAGTEKAVVVAQNPELGERCSATPAIADNALYVRTAGHLYAFVEK